MKKNLFLRLCLILMVSLTISSCRTDHLNENETYNNSSKFQLTSKRISLNESKHKSILLTEIEKVEAGLKKSKTNVNGRLIDYGNGVSIDTDDVIYIENGPNYHTYTFHIKRENAPADAPLENLLLVPLPDGKYKELLITYSLTSSEKEKIQAGLFVDTNGKSQVTELENGTFNGGSQLARLVCTTSSFSYWASCSENLHNGSNYEECTFFTNPANGTPPINYTIVTTTCLEQNEMIITPVDPGGNSGGGGGGSTPGGTTPPPNNPPCTGTTIPTNPQPGFTDENGCPIGAPSFPNYPPTKGNPCEKLKNTIDGITGLKNKILDLNKPENFKLSWEIGAVIQDNAQGQSGLIPKEGNAGETFINVLLSETGEVTGLVHVHFEGSVMSPVFSFEDLKTFAAIYQWRAYNNKPLDKLVMVVVSKAGTFAMVIEDMALFNTQAYKIWGAEGNDLAREYNNDLINKPQVIYDDVIKQVAKVLPTHGMGLYKASAGLNIWKKIVYNPLTDKAVETACN